MSEFFAVSFSVLAFLMALGCSARVRKLQETIPKIGAMMIKIGAQAEKLEKTIKEKGYDA